MAPFYAASGRRNYAKCTAWYLQEIDNLDEHTLRLLEASFVIRRKNVPYGAVSPGLGIEQSLMGVIKGRTGLKRGKEFTEVNYIIWCKNRPIIGTSLHEKSMTNYRPKMGRMSVRALGDTRSKKDTDNVGTVKLFFV